MSTKKILVIGDVMLDRYINGHAKRISPEAPVPVVLISNETANLGGAGNVAANLRNLEVDCHLVGLVGDDEYVGHVEQMCNDLEIEHTLLKLLPTTITKTRVIARHQQMIRIDREASDYLLPDEEADKISTSINVNDYSCIIISDYAKGVCTHRLLSLIISGANSAGVPVLIDPKGKDWTKYKGAYLVKPNLGELEDAVRISLDNQEEFSGDIVMELIKSNNIKNILVTRGEKGMTHIYYIGAKHYPTQKVDVYDVSGAGDTAISALAWAMINGKSLPESIAIANLASSYVVTKSMTYAISLAELKRLLND